MKHPKVSLIIINYNRKDYLKNCIESILKNTDYPNYEIVVVDNHSTDGSVELVRKNFPSVRLIENEKNYAFGGGANIGMKKTQGKYVVLLDNDTLVQPGWLPKIVEVAENDEKIAVAASVVILKSLYDLYKNNSNRNLNDEKIAKKVMADFYSRHDSLKGIEELSHVAISACLLRREVFEKIGFFSNYIFLFWEDTELCWRSILCGYKVVYVFDSLVYHHVGTTRRANPRWVFERIKNKFYIYLKLLDWQHAILYTSIALIKNFGGMIKDRETLKPRTKAVLYTIKNIKIILQDRKQFEKIKTTDTKKLIKLIKKTNKFEKINWIHEKGLPRNVS